MWPSNNASTILVNIVHAAAATWEWNVAIWNSSLMWMSICLSQDFSALCGSLCLRCRITGSGQLAWRTAKIPPDCLHHKHGLFSVPGHTKVKPSISVAKGIIYKNVDSLVFFCISPPAGLCYSSFRTPASSVLCLWKWTAQFQCNPASTRLIFQTLMAKIKRLKMRRARIRLPLHHSCPSIPPCLWLCTTYQMTPTV